VIYGNNDAQRIDVRRTLRDGERSPPLNLQGRGRGIKSIIIVARSLGGPRNRAFIDVYGSQLSRRGRGNCALSSRDTDECRLHGSPRL
jgi:hypothetical protein